MGSLLGFSSSFLAAQGACWGCGESPSPERGFCPQLALKHRQGKNHKMRIIAFVGSPVEDNEKDVSNGQSCGAGPGAASCTPPNRSAEELGGGRSVSLALPAFGRCSVGAE